MKIKIVSDGTTWGTHVVNAETGEQIQNVTKIDISIDAKDATAKTTLTLVRVPLEITSEATVVEALPVTSEDRATS